MSDHHTERDRSASVGTTSRRDVPGLSVAVVAVALLCGCLLTAAVLPAAGGTGDEPTEPSGTAGAAETAVADNRTAPGGALARTVVTHEARLGASFEASVLEEDLERTSSDRARARRLAQFEAGLGAALAVLQRRHDAAVERFLRSDGSAPSARTDLTRAAARARAVGELADRADATVESLPENATRETGVGPDDFDRHARSSAAIAENESDPADGGDTDDADESGFLIGDATDDPDDETEEQWTSCDRHWDDHWTDADDGHQSNATDCDDASRGSRPGDWNGSADAGDEAVPAPGFGVWFDGSDWRSNGSNWGHDDRRDGDDDDSGDWDRGDDEDSDRTGEWPTGGFDDDGTADDGSAHEWGGGFDGNESFSVDDDGAFGDHHEDAFEDDDDSGPSDPADDGPDYGDDAEDGFGEHDGFGEQDDFGEQDGFGDDGAFEDDGSSEEYGETGDGEDGFDGGFGEDDGADSDDDGDSPGFDEHDEFDDGGFENDGFDDDSENDGW